MTPSPTSPRIAVVLGGGGLKGFAHIGVLQELEARGIEPVLYAGTSIGALIAAARACGVSTGELAERAARLRRRHLFRINHVGMVMDRMRSASLYLEAPLRELVMSVVPHRRFRDCDMPLLVNTVDLEHGTQMVWGLPGLEDAWIDDAVYASCALPGFFPPGRVGGRVCIDGGTVDNLPTLFPAMLGVDAIIAVDVGSSDLRPMRGVAETGFAAIFMRAATIMMSSLQGQYLDLHRGAPMLLVRPDIAELGWFSFGRADDLIAAGRAAAVAALASLESCLAAPDGIFPRRAVELSVDRALCIGCGTCVALAPEHMALDANRRAYPIQRIVNWSPADGDFLRDCPTLAIRASDLPVADHCAEPPTAPIVRRPRIRRRIEQSRES